MEPRAASVAAALPARPAPPLLDRVDLLWILGLTVAGFGLRLVYASGYGLGDDIILRHFIAQIVEAGRVPVDNYSLRFTWWLPTALAARLGGVRELTLLLPTLVTAMLSIGLLYATGKALYARFGGIAAALLLIANPLDFAWSTMLTTDIMVSAAVTLCVLCFVRAAEQTSPAITTRLMILSALCFWIAFHGKVSIVLLGPALALMFWKHREALGWQIGDAIVTGTVLFTATLCFSCALYGDALWAYNSEIQFQGLAGPDAAKFHRLTADVFWRYPNYLFSTTTYGDRYFSFQPHLAVAFALLAWPLRLRTSSEAAWWLLFFLLGMQFNLQRVDGEWIAGFRNVRHIHAFAHPLVLVLAGFFASLALRQPRVAYALLAATVALGLWHGRELALKTQISFADRRAACAYLLGQPVATTWSDFQIETWCSVYPEWIAERRPFKTVPSMANGRAPALDAIPEGYLVTGGGREPHYGCIDCIPLASELDPEHWQLLREFPSPIGPTVWRPEPLRIWKRVPGGNDSNGAGGG